jgi:hypothetical protein
MQLMGSVRTGVASLLLGLLLATGAAAAASPPALDLDALAARREAARTAAGAAQTSFTAAKAALLAAAAPLGPDALAQPPAALEPALNAYLAAALDLVDASLQYALASNQELPLVLGPASLQSWLKEWPGNPLNDWKPMRIRADYSPGDLCWRVAGPFDYTFSQGHLRARSYVLAVYGQRRAPIYTTDQPWYVVQDALYRHYHHEVAALPSLEDDPALDEDAALAQDELWITRHPAAWAEAEQEAWSRQRAEDWAARWPDAGDPAQFAFIQRGLREYLRSAYLVEQQARALQAQPAGTWSVPQVTAYQQQALWLIYNGYNTWQWSGGDSDVFWSQPGLQPYWPANPYAEWQPIDLARRSHHADYDAVHDPAAPLPPFPAGQLVLDDCSSDFGKVDNQGRLLRSYELYILGRDAAATAANLALPDARRVWAGPPPAGAVGCLELLVSPQLTAEFNRAICHS